MEKKFTFILFLLFQNAIAQIPNADFQFWSNGTPDEWQTTNIPIVPPSIIPETSAHSGTLAVKGIVVSDSHNQPFPPYLGIYGSASQGFPINQRYNVVSGWYKLFLKPNDRFVADVRVYDSNQNPIGSGRLISDASINSWTQFKMNITYFDESIPSSCSLFFTITESTLLSSGQIGSYFILDDLSMLKEVETGTPKNGGDVYAYPNPAHKQIQVGNIPSGNYFDYTLNDISGKIVLTKKHCEANEFILTDNLLPGIYFLYGTSNENNFREKIVIE